MRTPLPFRPLAPTQPGTPRLLSWVSAGAALALPLVVSPSTADFYFLPKLLAGRLVVIAMLAGLGLTAVTGRLRFRRTPLDIPLALFVVSALVSTVFAVNGNLALFGSYGRYEGLLTILLYALLFWLTIQALDSPADAILVLRALLLAAFVVSVITIFQVAFGSLTRPGLGESGFSFAGVLRGYGTFGNPNALGAYLAMVLPVAAWELVAAQSSSGRWLATNVVIILALALIVTFSRSAWLGAGIGVTAVLAAAAPRRLRWAALATPVVLLLVVLGASRLGPSSTAPNIVQAAGGRLSTVETPLAGSSGQFRVHVWVDSLKVIGSRPLIGYGPDTFGLVYPRFQSGDWAHGAIIDRPHDELLGIAASQGIVGVIAFLVLLAVIVRAFWTSRRELLSVSVFGGLIAFLAYLVFNFSWLPASLPFWIFLPAAMTVWRLDSREPGVTQTAKGVGLRFAGGCVVVAGVVAILPLVVNPYRADDTYRAALHAAAMGQRQTATKLIHSARQLAPWQSTYAVAEGTLALDLQPNGRPGPDADWVAARAAYLDAARLGSFNAAAYRYLAISDGALGLRAEAIAAARMAVELDRFDSANWAELTQLLATIR